VVTESNIPVNVFVTTSAAQPTVTWNAEQPAPVQEPQPSDMITSQQAAILLGVTLNNLRQMVFKKKLVPVGKDGRKNLFSRADVEALMPIYIARQVRRGGK
jgi:excisionase family DNA binding protein